MIRLHLDAELAALAEQRRQRPSRPDPTAHPDEPLAAPSPADLTTRPHRGAVPHTDLEQLRDTINARRTP